MKKYTVKDGKTAWKYEICDYSWDSEKKYLKITKFYKGKYACEESVDLSEINPEFFEVLSENKPCLLTVLLACVAGSLFLVIFLAIFIILLSGQKLMIPAIFSLLPLIAGWYCWSYARSKKDKTNAKFVFEDEEYCRITVPYIGRKRAETLQFVRTIATYCNQEMLCPQQLPVIRHQFSQGVVAELRDAEIVLFGKNGIKMGSCPYALCVPGVVHLVEHHWFKNFFCIFFAALFWIGPLAQIIYVVGNVNDPAMIAGFGIIHIIPFVLGCFFLSKYQKSQNFYYAGSRVDENDDSGICLVVGKNPGSEKEFIDELSKRLRLAYNLLRQTDQLHPPEETTSVANDDDKASQ